MSINYSVQKAADWGGYIQLNHVVPGHAYWNLTHSDTITLDYRIDGSASKADVTYFRFMMFDASQVI